jgi:hypothetical protein
MVNSQFGLTDWTALEQISRKQRTGLAALGIKFPMWTGKWAVTAAITLFPVFSIAFPSHIWWKLQEAQHLCGNQSISLKAAQWECDQVF